MEIKDKASIGLKFLMMLLIVLLIYYQDLSILINEALKSNLVTHILLIPFILTYMLYRIRNIIFVSASNYLSVSVVKYFKIKDIIGVLLCMLSYLIKWFGSYTFYTFEYHIVSIPLFIAGITLILFNVQTLRSMIFPIAFLIFLIPPPIELMQSIGSSLALLSSQISYFLVKTAGLPVKLINTFASPIIYLTAKTGEEIPFSIDIACSGLYSLIGFIIFSTFIAYIARGSLIKKTFIFFLGLPLIYILNVFRIVFIVIIGYYSGSTLSLKLFHLFGGWTLIFIGALMVLIIAEKTLGITFFGKIQTSCDHINEFKDQSFCANCGKLLKTTHNTFTKSDVLKFTFIFLIIISLLFINVPVFVLTKGSAEVFMRNLSNEQTTSKILPNIEGYQLKFAYRDTEFEEISGQNASLAFVYKPEDSSKRAAWVAIEIGSTRACLHKWEVCLITWRQTHGMDVEVTQIDLRDIHLLDNPPISARYFAFQSKLSNITQVILYWYTRSIFDTHEGYETKWTKISVIEYTSNSSEYRAIEDDLLLFAKEIVDYWNPINKWSTAAITITKNGSVLIALTGSLLIFFIINYVYINNKKHLKAEYMYTKINNIEERQIIDSIKSLNNKTATYSNIAKRYKEISGKIIKLKELHNKLIISEKNGLIEKKILNIDDIPYVTWKFI